MIKYQYEVKSVDAVNGVMEVLYTSEYQTSMLVSMPLPTTTQTLEDVVSQYAPLAYWEQQNAVRVVPQVGASGTMDPVKAAAEAVPVAAIEVTRVTTL